MRYWLHLHNTLPEDAVEIAVLAEQLGFEGVLGDDHWFMPAASDNADPNERAVLPWDYNFPDMFVTGASLLARTTTLKFGSCIMVLGNRTNPFLVAKQCATLARVSGDRFLLGVGIGWMKEEYDMAGVDWSTRAPRMAEMIDILRKLWGEGPVSHTGEHFEFPATYANPRPDRPIPIYIGGIAPPALRRAGRIADGWMGMTSKLADLPAQIALIEEGRREAGREHEPFAFMCGLARNDDGTLPSRDDYARAEEMGITIGHVGPAEHALGKPYLTFDEKKRFAEEFANRVIR
jgi:probable F420-dependent oxidoreductase